MTQLLLHSKKIKSVFQLLGANENDISFSIGWALSKCPVFLMDFLHIVVGYKESITDVEIRLQEHETHRGYTDIEIFLSGKFHIIIEAKKGWTLPGNEQLSKYAQRKAFASALTPKNRKRLVVMTECSDEYATCNLNIKKIDGVLLKNISWAAMAKMARGSLRKSSNAEKRLLKELLVYLGGLMNMQKVDSNLVYVVAIGNTMPKGWRISFIDVIEKRSLYFHRMGINGWPKEPPNYIAFRYHGKLQSIHHIESYKVVKELHHEIKEIPMGERYPLFLYKLGPAILPTKTVKKGRIYPNGRVWCMMDTLFTCDTISEARDLTKKRLNEE